MAAKKHKVIVDEVQLIHLVRCVQCRTDFVRAKPLDKKVEVNEANQMELLALYELQKVLANAPRA